MARARNIKPGFFTNDRLAECHPLARLLFSGLWCLADREGRLEDRPKKIRAELLPYDNCDAAGLLTELANGGFITRYEVGGMGYIQIVNWHKHQNPHHMEAPSEIPAPPGTDNRYNHAPISKAQRERIFARDGGKCVSCQSREDLHIDHIVPVSSGGSSKDSNLQTLCAKCNLSKGSRTCDVGSSTTREQLDNDSSTGQPRTLIPDSLIPDSGFRIPEVGAAPKAAPPPSTSEASPVAITVPLTGNRSHAVTEADLARLRELHPAIDAMHSLRRMVAWLEADPSRQSATARGARKRIASWLGGDQDRAGASKARAGPADPAVPKGMEGVVRLEQLKSRILEERRASRLVADGDPGGAAAPVAAAPGQLTTDG